MIELDKYISYVRAANAVEKLILLCILFFLIALFTPQFILDWFALPTNFDVFISKPWTIVTYGFFHIRFLHILSNLLILFYFGNLFLDFFNTNKFYFYFIFGVIIGGIAFLIFNRYFETTNRFPLIGSSAGISAILVGIAAKVPHYPIKFRFLGSIEIWILAVIWLLFSVLGTSGVDSGAAVAHLAGGIFGYLATILIDKTHLNFSGNKRNLKKTKFNKIYKNPNNIKTVKSFRMKKEQEEQINLILDKISKTGYDSLTKEEKEFLFNQKES